MEKNSIIIRKFSVKDRESVRSINCATAFMGKPSSVFFEGDEVFADALTAYFTDYEPESCFVAEYRGDVIGYLIGAKDVALLNKVTRIKILPGVLLKAFTQSVVTKKKNLIFFARILLSLFRGELSVPDFSSLYPATLHINMKEGFSDLGAGARLISAYLEYLKKEKVRGVHLATMSDAAGAFFRKQGFDLLYSSRRSYFRHILHKDITVYIDGKRLLDEMTPSER